MKFIFLNLENTARLFKIGVFGSTISIELIFSSTFSEGGLSKPEWVDFFKASLPFNDGDVLMNSEGDGLIASNEDENTTEVDPNSPWYFPL